MGIHDATVDDIEEVLVARFPSSHSRRRLFDGWLAYRSLIRRYVNVRRELLDGSFVTDKAHPKDIDLSLWIDADELIALSPDDQHSLGTLFQKPVMSSYGCDAYLVPECSIGHPVYPAFQGMLWTDGHWKAVRDKNRAVVPGVHKGYLRVVSP